MNNEDETREEFLERLEKVSYAWETIMEEQHGITHEQAYYHEFDDTVEVGLELNMCELFFCIQFIQNNMKGSNPVGNVLATGFISSLLEGVPEEYFDKAINEQPHMPGDKQEGISFQ